MHPVYIDDMTDAFLLCAEKPEAIGHSYNIAGERPVSFKVLSTAIAHALGKELPKGDIPLRLANLASDIFSLIPGFQGERAPLTRSRVKFLTNSRVYSIERAKKNWLCPKSRTRRGDAPDGGVVSETRLLVEGDQRCIWIRPLAAEDAETKTC